MSSLKQKVAHHRKKRNVSTSSPGKRKSTLKKHFLGFDRKVSLKFLIDAYLKTNPEFISFNAELSRNKLIGFHPSNLHNNCPRRIAFGLINEKHLFKDDIQENELDEVDSWITPKIRRTFDTGHMIHFLIQLGYLKGMRKKHNVEVPNRDLYKRYLIGGTSDVIVRLQDGYEWVIDLKTIKQELFLKLNEGDYTTLQAHYIIQLLLYMFGLKKTRGGILYWNKNDGDIKEFYFKFPSVSAIKPFIQNELNIALRGKSFLMGKRIPILDECEKQEGRYEKCEYSTVCFRCNKGADLLKLTKAKKFTTLTK